MLRTFKYIIFKAMAITIVIILLVNNNVISLSKTSASEDSSILQINNLYKSKSDINTQKEKLDTEKARITDLMVRVDKGICTREDMIFGTELTVEETLEKHNLEVSLLDEEIAKKEKEIKDIDKLVDVYDRLVSQETSTISNAIDEYSKVKLKIVSSDDEGTGNEFENPVPGSTLTSPYGNRIHPIFKARRFHTGVDLANKQGTPIHAAERGVVIYSNYTSGTGNTVVMAHNNGYFTLYAHIKNNGLLVKKGDAVEKGQKIALMGSTGLSTGPHLHFEVHKGKEKVNPASYIKIK